MHSIEPYFNWRELYVSSDDDRSPFYGREYSEVYYTDAIYDHYIHPQWDNIGSPTLFLKVIYVDYDESFAMIELMGEWNDCINNDIMILKRDIIESMMLEGINKYILIGENVLNFHASDDCYYEEWSDELEDGWIVGLNFRNHVIKEFENSNLDYYIAFGGKFNTLDWRTYRPLPLFQRVEEIMNSRLISLV